MPSKRCTIQEHNEQLMLAIFLHAGSISMCVVPASWHVGNSVQVVRSRRLLAQYIVSPYKYNALVSSYVQVADF
jgi:hypothetical protein